MKNFITYASIVTLSSVLAINTAIAAPAGVFAQYYDAAQNYMEQGQYSSAVAEFRKALRINFLDNSARIGIINAYLARATYYANQEKNYDKAANDFRSALFYLKLYPTKEQAVQNSTGMIASANENLNQCLKVISFDRTAKSRYKKAEELRAIGNFSAAAFEFYQAAQNETLAADANVQIADLMKVLGNEPRSADFYKQALDSKPSDSLLRMKYARTLDKLNRHDEAVIQYNSALANSKGDMEILYALERIYLKKLAVTPSDAELNANIGAIKQAQGDFETALSYYGKAEQLNPNNINTRLNVGTLFQQKKDYLKAIKSYDSVLTLYPDNVQATLYKAQALSEMGDKKQASELYKKVLKLEPTNITAKTELVSVLKDTLNPKEYLAYLSQNASDNTMQNLMYEYALQLHKSNDFENAIFAYKSVVENNPTNADAYVNLAICYASQNNYPKAKEILKDAKSKFPTNNLVLKTLQNVEKDSVSTILADASKDFEAKNYQKALEQYLAIKPATEDSLLGIAASYQALENFDSAIEYYKKAENVSPKNSDIPYYIGYLYSEQQKWVESEKYLKKALTLNPESEAKNLLKYVLQNYTVAELNTGINLYETKDFESALLKFNEVIKKESNNAFAYYYRGLIYDDQKKYKMALNDYQKFVEIYTTDDDYSKYVKARIEEIKPFAGG